jgi:hypothetical protein
VDGIGFSTRERTFHTMSVLKTRDHAASRIKPASADDRTRRPDRKENATTFRSRNTPMPFRGARMIGFASYPASFASLARMEGRVSKVLHARIACGVRITSQVIDSSHVRR